MLPANEPGGRTTAPAGRSTLTVSCLNPALESTLTPLAIRPLLPRRLTVTSSGPPAAGARRQGWEGSLATVQPQEVRTLLTNTSAEETFVSQKVKRASVSPGLALYSFTSASHLRALGSLGGAGARGDSTRGEGATRGGSAVGGSGS